MRHRRQTHRLGCKTAHRKAMLGNMVTSLLRHGRIITTVPRAKEARRLADKMITLAKRADLHARRQVFAIIHDRQVVADLFDKWGQKFVDRMGGYTRIVRIGPRRGDAAMLSVLEMATDALERPSSHHRPKKTVSPDSVIPQAAPRPVVDTTEETAEAKAIETVGGKDTESTDDQSPDADTDVQGPEMENKKDKEGTEENQ
ncbi:MAG: 50S ribosomal protein L17 [Nitrospiraceae bacterium]|nr:50S ribosomal protein L17 [Nitrospiraceae bacterium]